MLYSPLTVANTFLALGRRDGRELTPMHLQKLVYMAHGWKLALTDAPLQRAQVEAWKFGPVLPPLYYETRRHGSDPVDAPIDVHRNPFLAKPDDPVSVGKEDWLALGAIRLTWKRYGHLSGPELSHLTHRPGTPWHRVWNDQGGRDRLGAVIPEDLIKEHYKALMEKVVDSLSDG